MKIFYKIEEFMLDLFPNKFAKSNVFALLYGIKTWRGSTRKLADALRMPESSLRAVMTELIAEGYIRKTNDGYQCAYTAQQSAQQSEESAHQPAATAQNCATPAPLLPTPLITKEIKKERENNIARETIATQNPTPSSLSHFDEFIELYKVLSNNTIIPSDFIADAKQKWESLLEWQKEELLNEMRKPNGFYKGSPLLTITYFKFQGPKNYDSLARYELDKAARELELWSTIVVPNERAWICTIEDIRKFGLKEIKRFLPQN